MSGLLEVDHLEVSVPVDGATRTIISDVSFDVGAAEAVGLVGESGSGKSMTARSILRLLPAGSTVRGDVRFGSRSVLTLSQGELLRFRASEVAMVFQDPRAHINPVRRIDDFLVEALRFCHRASRTEALQTVTKLLAETGIADPERLLRQYPHQLSGGLLQRVMIAAALAVRPELLIADEPTTALDVTTQSEVIALLNELRASHGAALLFITHDLDLAAAVCDRTVVIYAGKVVEVRSSNILHSDPLHPYTAALVTSRPSVNAATERLTAIRGRPCSAFEVRAGCPFAPRCAYATERCSEVEPPLVEFADGQVACWHAGELRGTLSQEALADNE